MTIPDMLEMPVGYIQTLYAIALEESEESEKKKDNSKAMEVLEDEIM